MMQAFVLLALSFVLSVNGARILSLLPSASHSHYIWNRQLMVALSKRGHHVTVVSPDKEEAAPPNFRHIYLEGVYDILMSGYSSDDFQEGSVLRDALMTFDWGQAICAISLKTKGAAQLLQLTKNETFDLIMVETALTECFLGFIPLFGSPPVVGIGVFSSPPWISEFMGSPVNPSYMSSYMMTFSDRMTFTQRLRNLIMYVIVALYRQLHHMPAQQRLVNQYISPDLPPLKELEYNISLTFVNIDQRLDFPRPLVPGMIPVGGLHISEPKPLEKSIQTFLDEAKEGAIFFSFGSNIRSDQLNAKMIEIFLEAFREIPQRVLWKWESDALPGKPPNVMISKWLPQRDILAHPNIRLFITHSGLLSSYEATHRGVPVVGIPLFIDQHINIQRQIDRGTGVKLDFYRLSKDSVLAAITEVLRNNSYRERAMEWSHIFRDLPMSPLDTAIFWTEYVLRHRGANNLRSAALQLTWYQYWLLDVIAVVLSATIATLFLIYSIIKLVIRIVKKSLGRNKVKLH